MIFKTYNSYFNRFIEKLLLLFPFTSPTESTLFLFKYAAYVNMNFRCYGCSKHPKKIRKHPKNIRKKSEKDPKKIRKHPKNIWTKNCAKSSENIRKTSEKYPKKIKKRSKKDPKKNYGMFFGTWYSFSYCILYLRSFVQYHIIIRFILLFPVSIH